MNEQFDPSREALALARSTLQQIESRGTVSGRRPKFFFFHLVDAFRLGTMTRALADLATQSEVFTAAAIEILVRHMVEQAILISYVGIYAGDEVIDRLLKTSASEFVKSWREDYKTDDKDLPVKLLPDYRQMAEASDPALYDVYQRYSYLVHPRSGLSYSLVEHENAKSRNISPRAFYQHRCRNALADMAYCLTLIRAIFEREDAEWQKEQSQSSAA